MADRLSNPNAIAKQNGGQAVQVVNLGDGAAFLGIDLRPQFREYQCGCGDAKPEVGHVETCLARLGPVLVVGVFATGCKHSPLQIAVDPKDVRSVQIAEFPPVSVELLKRAFTEEAKPDEAATH